MAAPVTTHERALIDVLHGPRVAPPPRLRPPQTAGVCANVWVTQPSAAYPTAEPPSRAILYAYSGQLNDDGQWIYYGRVGGVVVTGNEDGIKHVAMNVLYSLQHLGYVIPPQADCGWIGEAGPRPSYADPDSGGLDNEFTRRNTTFMTWNLMHLAAMLKRNDGIPAHGNQRAARDAGTRFDHPDPEYR